MNAANKNEASEVELLLPWHAAGTLNLRDSERVEAALASDPELARRYESVREELGETIHLNETLGAPSARAMEALFAKIGDEPRRTPRLAMSVGVRIREFFANRSPRVLAWSASAAALAILLQAGIIAGVLLQGNGNGAASYQTASVPTEAGGQGSYVLIRFQPQANAAAISKFLEQNSLTLAGGPSAGDLYRVRIAAEKLRQNDFADLIKKLQANEVVGFIAATQ
jgi:hypothetical protein